MEQGKQIRTAYRMAENCGNFCRRFFALELMIHAVLLLLENEFPEWRISRSYVAWMQLGILFVFVYFEILSGMKKSIRRTGKIVAGILVPMITGFFILGKMYELIRGFHVIYNDYMKYWNAYYYTNYGFYETEGTGRDFILAVLVTLVILFFLMLCYLTGSRLFYFFPTLFTLSLGLLVNRLPEWRGLAELFLGMLLFFSASWDKGKIVFSLCPGSEPRVPRRLANQVFTTVVVLVLGSTMVLGVPELMGRKAEKLPEYSEIFLSFQKEAEEKLAGLSGQIFSQDQEFVDNRTPKYSGRKILEIETSRRPDTNLYLKDFCSGVYTRGKWQKTDAFEKEAKQAGYTPEHLGSMLHQQYFEQKRTREAKEGEEIAPVLEYTLKYKGKRTGYALVPYFSDLSESSGQAWIMDDEVVHKKKSTKTLKLQGLSQNTFFTGDLQESYHQTDKNAAMEWYGSYVKQQNLGGSQEIPALKQYAQEIEETYGITRISDVDLDYETNYNRLLTAAVVRSILSEKETYNLYLDSIPAGCDTIQYFLETGHEGYCMHFASAGVLLLQELGVPARYASGYIVKASSFQRENGQYKARVLDRNAHAWAEIYLENYGWIPYEMTPGYQDVISSLPTDEEHQDYLKRQHEKKATKTQQTSEKSTIETQGSESEKSQPQVSETSEAGTETSEISTGASGGTRGKTRMESGRLAVITGLFLMILFCGGLLIWHLKKEQETLSREIHGRQYRSALIRMNRKIYHRLWNHGPEVLHLPTKKGTGSRMHLSYLTDEEFLQKLMQTYPAVSPEDWKRYMEIVQKAAFSQEEITREEMRFCYSIYQRYRRKR